MFLNDKTQLQINLIRKECNGVPKTYCYVSRHIGLLCFRLQLGPEVNGNFSICVQESEVVRRKTHTIAMCPQAVNTWHALTTSFGRAC